MPNDELTPHEPGAIDDDGFHGSLNSSRSNNYLKWTAAAHWIDRDGIAPPSPLLVFAVDEALRMWKDNKPTTIHDKPLPSVDELNNSIPESEWELGIDGKKRKPWEHIVIVRLVNFATGELYKYEAATTGAHIAFDAVKEQVITMRALRGERVMPVVNLTERPMKTNFGVGRRPHFEIIGWQTPGDGNKAVPAKPAPQLSGPTVVPKETPAAPLTTPSPTSNPASYQAKPKPPVNLAGETIAAMGDVKPVTMSEVLDDEVPW